MKLAAVISAMALGFVAAGPALAQNWTYVASNSDNNQYSLDTASVRPHGNYVESWQKQVLQRPARLDNGKAYVVVLSHRLDDCAAGTMTEIDVIFTDAKGSAVKTYNLPEANAQFRAMPPGSIGQTMQAQVCAYSRRLAALKPVLSLDIFADEEWIALGSNPAYLETVLARKTIRREGAKAVYATRSQTRAPMKTVNGAVYRTTYQAWQMDCELGTARNLAADYYDDSNVLVDVSSADDLANLPFTPVNPGTPLDAAKKLVCATQSASQGSGDSKDEAGVSSGTGWLGPKGYIITASHVVGEAKVVGVAQEGKIVGTAEVVVSDPANDVAILKPKFDSGVHPVISLAPGPAVLGEHVFTLGYPSPDDLGLSVKMTSGEVSSLNGSAKDGRVDDARLLQISTPVQHGNSGGPLFDEHGQAVGIILAGFGAASDLQNVNYAVKIAYVRSLLSELPDLGGYRPLKVSASIPGLVADLRQSVFMLVVVPDKEE